MHNFLAIYSIWLRDVIRVGRDRSRIVGAMAQPILYLFVFGTGMSRAFTTTSAKSLPFGGQNYVVFLYPGILGMAILFTSIFSAISIVWDREFGFLKEVMVAPISRATVAVGKGLGGSTIALGQGIVILLFAPLAGVHLSWQTVLLLIPTMALVAFSLTSLGIVVASRMRTMEGFQMIMNFLMMPLFFLSGAMFPLQRLPGWLTVLTRLNPLSYGVDALRTIVLGPQAQIYPLTVDIGVVAIFGAVCMTTAAWLFNKVD